MRVYDLFQVTHAIATSVVPASGMPPDADGTTNLALAFGPFFVSRQPNKLDPLS